MERSYRPVLDVAFDYALQFLDSLPERRAFPEMPYAELRELLGTRGAGESVDASQVIAELAQVADRGVVASPGGRYFGFVIGGSVPAALAADWLTATWDQNAAGFAASPFASAIEEVTMKWIIELLGLPPHVSCGFVTGGQMANVTGLAAARHHVLARAGWDVERQGLVGTPAIRVLVGAERHLSIDQALRFLGIGTDAIVEVGVDSQGRMDPSALREALAGWDGPAIVCAQAGNINSGSVDPLDAICDVAAGSDAWMHVDGAIGLWAVTSERYRPLLRGLERADSWATDAHKWLNVPYDSGLVFCAHPDAHKAAMSIDAPYIVRGPERPGADWTPEWSRRARAVPIYAAIRSLGRAGIVGIVERCCAHAQRFAAALSAAEGVEVLNDVVLNQVVVRFPDPDGDHDARTRAVIAKVQDDGVCWLGGTVWQGRAAMRISVTNWSTTDDDVERSIGAILRAAALA
jgi:glutamate/tyrosine decarboxylase-like PLP-dependent enzyme